MPPRRQRRKQKHPRRLVIAGEAAQEIVALSAADLHHAMSMMSTLWAMLDLCLCEVGAHCRFGDVKIAGAPGRGKRISDHKPVLPDADPGHGMARVRAVRRSTPPIGASKSIRAD
jgi:hypothetical protein